MKILLAWPWTWKTTKVKTLISNNWNWSNFLVISFTNATVNDLQQELIDYWITEKNCMTLHKFAVKYNHNNDNHVLDLNEIKIIKQIEKQTSIWFKDLCKFLKCTTYEQMIEDFVNFSKTNQIYIKEILERFDSIIVDEYQDFNPTEQKLIEILLEYIENSYILWDDDQCIYDFKDASSEKIISFYNDELNEKISHENICYRCPDCIVDHASLLIQNNNNRINKEWRKSWKQWEIIFNQYRNLNEVSDSIINNLDINKKTLILSPVRFTADLIITKLEQYWIDFWNYFNDAIDESLVTKWWFVKSMYWKFKFTNLIFTSYTLLDNRKKFYEKIKEQFNRWENYNDFLLILWKKNEQIINNWFTLDEFLNQEEHKDILSFYNNAEWDNPEEKLENLFYLKDDISEKNIKVMSIHKAKWLWAEQVFIVWLNEWILPNATKWNDSIESQRRLFFVWITRAKEKLYLYSHIENEGKDINTVDKSKFDYKYFKKKYYWKTSSFINELKLS